MRLMRILANILLWMLAILGVVSGALFVGSRAGVVQPVVVISGSMTPDIQPGDLLITTKSPIEELQPGAVATIRSAHTGNFVTHRVIAVEPQGDDFAVTMKGDANDVVDAETYLIPTGSEVWLPKLTVPAGGLVAESISNPRVATPALITILALIVMSFFSPPPPKHHDPRATLKMTRARDREGARHLASDERTRQRTGGGIVVKTLLRHRIIAALVVAVLAIPTMAMAQETFTVTFEDLVPGVAQSASFPHELGQDAVFRGLTWVEQTGALEFAELDAEVCASNGVCVDDAGSTDTIFRAGTLTITVTAIVDDAAPQDATGTASGRLTFAAPDDAIDGDLPFTGAPLLEMTVWAAALVSIGALVVVVARRRDSEEAAP